MPWFLAGNGVLVAVGITVGGGVGEDQQVVVGHQLQLYGKARFGIPVDYGHHVVDGGAHYSRRWVRNGSGGGSKFGVSRYRQAESPQLAIASMPRYSRLRRAPPALCTLQLMGSWVNQVLFVVTEIVFGVFPYDRGDKHRGRIVQSHHPVETDRTEGKVNPEVRVVGTLPFIGVDVPKLLVPDASPAPAGCGIADRAIGQGDVNSTVLWYSWTVDAPGRFGGLLIFNIQGRRNFRQVYRFLSLPLQFVDRSPKGCLFFPEHARAEFSRRIRLIIII